MESRFQGQRLIKVCYSVSKEEDVQEGHNIVPNGYDVGRDLLVSSAVAGGGTTNQNGIEYQTTAQNITGLLQPGSNGINHGKPFELPYNNILG
jgi:hypothetical protein